MPTSPAQPFALEATRENFDQLVVENSRKGPVLVDFWAAWAGPSLRQRELLLKLAHEYGGRFLLVTVDTDRQKPIAERFGVKSLPSCKLFRRGEAVEHIHGMQTEADYRELIERHIVPLADKAQAAALRAWQAGDQDRAVRVLAEAAMAEPDDPALPLLLGKLLVQADRYEDVHAVLRSVPPAVAVHPEIQRLETHVALIRQARAAPPPAELEAALARDPDDADARFSLAAVSLVEDDYPAALELLAELHRRKPDFRSGLPRRALVTLLDLLGAEDELARRYRKLLFQH
jgi:putative thioredoxin